MSAVAATPASPPLTRLTLVELRKMLDTRAGLWLQLVTATLSVAVVAVVGIVGDHADQALDSLLPAAAAPAMFLLPVVGILLVTSEWSQRTTLITFTLVPQRLRVLAAKLLAGMLLVLAALAAALAVAATGTAAAGGAWTLSPGLLGQTAVALAAGMGMGIAFGAVIRASAPAIVIFFVLPTALGALGSLHAFEDVARWLDTNRTLAPLTEHLLTGTEWARAGTSLVLWLLVPLAAGAWRLTCEDLGSC
jgi:ABC-2 type transport system permease protein